MGTVAGLLEFFKNAALFDIGVFIFIVLIYRFFREKIYYIPKISGAWEMTLQYDKSEYNPFLGMEVYYKLFIQQDGEKITIDSEKYAEKQPGKKILYYAPHGKTLGEYYGNLRRSYMNHLVELNIREQGLIRNVVGRLNLKVISYCQMEGTFEKGDASSSGKVVCTKVV